VRLTQSTALKGFKYIFVPLTISTDQTRRALVIDFTRYGALEIVSVVVVVIIKDE